MPAQVRTATLDDIDGLLELQHACYPLLAQTSLWRRDHLESHQRNFRDGQLVAEVEGQLVGHCATFRSTRAVALRPHTFRDITRRGTFDGHVPDGDVLYGAEIMVHPDHRRRGLAGKFYAARRDVMERWAIPYFVAGGRIPGYESHASSMTAKAYVDAVVAGRLKDRVLSTQLRNGLRVVDVMPDYLSDPRSLNHATLLLWAPFEENARIVQAPARAAKAR